MPMTYKTEIMDEEKIKWLRLVRTPQIGPINFYKLLEETNYDIGKAIIELPEISKRRGHKKIITPYPEHLAIKEFENLRKLGGNLLTENDAAYPEILRNINDKPPVLSFIGDINLLTRNPIAMVGARNASLNGKKFAKKLASDLGSMNRVIVSGFARGIDTAAHEGSLKTGTIAVMAGGIDIIYPPQNKDLYHEIINNGGLIIAESPLGSQPMAKHFPRRNRIVSGLSPLTVVIEATYGSGSLITARLAAEQGRDVCAVPGSPMDPRAQGPNKLIRDGAILIQSASDIIETLSTPIDQLSLFNSNNNQTLDITKDTEDNITDKININPAILVERNLSNVPVSVDELARTCQLNIADIQTILLDMELEGKITKHYGNRISLCS